MPQTLSAVFALNDKFTANFRKIINEVDKGNAKITDATKLLNSFEKRTSTIKNSALGAANGISGITSKLTGLVSAAYLAKRAFDGMISIVNASSLRDVQEKTYQGLLESEKIGAQFAQFAKDYGKFSLIGQEGAGKAFSSFIPMTRDLERLKQLEQLTQRLYAKDPTQGAAGAVFAMKELLAGDTMSVKERYNMIGFDPKKIRELSNTGNISELISYVDQMFNKFGATQNVVDKMADTMPIQLNHIKDSFKSAFGETATPVMQQLSETVKRLNENMQSGKYQPFINVIVNGIEAIGNGIAFLADNANWLIPVVGSLVGGLLIYKGVCVAVAGAQTIMAITAGITTGNLVQLAGAIAAVVGAGSIMASLSKSVDGISPSIDMNNFKSNLKSTSLPVELTNTDPVKVTGQVDIEKENLKYLLDIAGAKFFAKYSTATLAPQLLIQNMNVTKETDTDTVVNNLTEGLAQASAANAQGVYSYA